MKLPQFKTQTLKASLILAALSVAMIQCAQVPNLVPANGDSIDSSVLYDSRGGSQQRAIGALVDSNQDGEIDGIDSDNDGEIDTPLNGKVLLCHNDSNPHTISVAPQAVDAHLQHHNDCLGACPCE
jgi:hypothetical protein